MYSPKHALLLSITKMYPLQLRCIFSTTFSNNIESTIIKIKNHNATDNYPPIIVTPLISVFLCFFRPLHISHISKFLYAYAVHFDISLRSCSTIYF